MYLFSWRQIFDSEIISKPSQDFYSLGIVYNVTYSPLCQDCALECEVFIYFTQNSIIHNILTSLGEYMKSLKQRYNPSYVR